MQNVINKIRNLASSVSSIADRSSGLSMTVPRIHSRLKQVIDDARKVRTPFVRRYIVHLKEDGSEVLCYHFSLRQKLILDELCPAGQIVRRAFVHRIPEATFIVDWDRYLSGGLEFPKMRIGEIRQAIPFKLSSISPFDVDGLCYCINNLSDVVEGRLSLQVDYSDRESVQSRLNRESELHLYPSRILAESHVWEGLFRTLAPRALDAAESNCLYVRFTGTYAQLGIVGPKISIPSQTVTLVEDNSSYLETVYNAMLSMLSEFQTDCPEGKVAKAYMTGSQERIDGFLEEFETSLPTPVEVMNTEAVLEAISGFKFLNKTGKGIPTVFCALLASRDVHVPQLEPGPSLARPFASRYMRSNISYVCVLVLSLLVLLAAGLQIKVYQSDQRLRSMQEEIARLQPAYKRLSSLMDALDRQVQPPRSGAMALDDMHQVAKSKPKDLYFASLNYDRGNRISIRGYANSPDSPVRYVKDLQENTDFPEVRLKRVSQMRDSDRVEYQIDVILKE